MSEIPLLPYIDISELRTLTEKASEMPGRPLREQNPTRQALYNQWSQEITERIFETLAYAAPEVLRRAAVLQSTTASLALPFSDPTVEVLVIRKLREHFEKMGFTVGVRHEPDGFLSETEDILQEPETVTRVDISWIL